MNIHIMLHDLSLLLMGKNFETIEALAQLFRVATKIVF